MISTMLSMVTSSAKTTTAIMLMNYVGVEFSEELNVTVTETQPNIHSRRIKNFFAAARARRMPVKYATYCDAFTSEVCHLIPPNQENREGEFGIIDIEGDTENEVVQLVANMDTDLILMPHSAESRIKSIQELEKTLQIIETEARDSLEKVRLFVTKYNDDEEALEDIDRLSQKHQVMAAANDPILYSDSIEKMLSAGINPYLAVNEKDYLSKVNRNLRDKFSMNECEEVVESHANFFEWLRMDIDVR